MPDENIYCEPGNFLDLELYSNPTSFKFNETGVDLGTLNLVGWMMRGLPYKKIRTLVTCGVYYKYQVEFGPCAVFNNKDGFLRDLIRSVYDDPRLRTVEILPTGDSGTDTPRGYESYMERHGISSGMKRGFVALSDLHTGCPVYCSEPPPTKTSKGQYIGEGFFDPMTSSCSTKTMLLFKSTLEAMCTLKKKWNNDVGCVLSAKFLEMDAVPQAPPALILVIKRENLHGLCLDYFPRIHAPPEEHFPVHLMTTGVKMLRSSYKDACSVWEVLDCDQVSHFKLNEMSEDFPNKKREFYAYIADIVKAGNKFAFPLPFYKDGFVEYYGLFFVMTKADWKDSVFISVLPKEFESTAGSVELIARQLYNALLPGSSDIPLPTAQMRHTYMQELVTSKHSGGWVLIILETLLNYISTYSGENRNERINKFPSRNIPATNMHLSEANIAGVMKNVKDVYSMSVIMSESIIQNVEIMDRKKRYAPPTLKIGEGTGTNLTVCSFHTIMEIKSTVAEIERMTTIVVEKVQVASDVHTIVITDIAFGKDTKVVAYAGVDVAVLSGRYEKGLAPGYLRSMFFFKERVTPEGKPQRYFVLMQISVPGQGNQRCWVVKDHTASEPINADVIGKQNIYLASPPFQKTEKSDFAVFGTGPDGWFACINQNYETKHKNKKDLVHPILGKKWAPLIKTTLNAFEKTGKVVDLEKLASIAKNPVVNSKAAKVNNRDQRDMVKLAREISEITGKDDISRWFFYMTESDETVNRIAGERLDVDALNVRRGVFRVGKESWVLDRGYSDYIRHPSGVLVKGILVDPPCHEYNALIQKSKAHGVSLLDEFYLGLGYKNVLGSLFLRYKNWFFQALPTTPEFSSEIENFIFCVWFGIQAYAQNKRNLPSFYLLPMNRRVQYLLGWYALKFTTPGKMTMYIIEWLSDAANTNELDSSDVQETLGMLKDGQKPLKLVNKRLVATALNLNIFEYFPVNSLDITDECSAFNISHAVISTPMLKFTAPVEWIPDTLDVTRGTLPEIKTIVGKALDFDSQDSNIICACMELDPNLNGEIMSLSGESEFFKALSGYEAFKTESDAKRMFKQCIKDVFVRHLAVLKSNGYTETFDPYHSDTQTTQTPLDEKELRNVIGVKTGVAVDEILNYHHNDGKMIDFYEEWLRNFLVLNLDIASGCQLVEVLKMLRRVDNPIWNSINKWNTVLRDILHNICDVLKQALIDYEEQSSKTNSDKKD